MRRSNAYKHKNKITKDWRAGKLVTELAAEYSCDARVIRVILTAKVGQEEYDRINNSRRGAGAAVRKANPRYPKWM